jgi:hypothetical protein
MARKVLLICVTLVLLGLAAVVLYLLWLGPGRPYGR